MSQAIFDEFINGLAKPKECGKCKKKFTNKRIANEGYLFTPKAVPFRFMCWDCTTKAVRELDDMED